MKHIEQFNQTLNMRHYYEDDLTTQFNKTIELLLKNHFNRLSERNRIVIIGAGNLSEVSLDFLLRYFEEVVLTDVDISSVEKAYHYARLTKEDKKRVIIKRIEYTGFEHIEFFVDFKERLANCRTKEKIEQVLKSKLRGVKQYSFYEEIQDADFIYVSPIYTQLVYQQVLQECSILDQNGYPKHLVNIIREFMMEEMPGVIERFNYNITRALLPHGELFVLSDIFQLKRNSGFYRRVKNSINNFQVMEELYNNYKDKYGMGLGDYGLYNLDEKRKRGLSRWLIWPFNDESSFIVKLNIYTK